MNVVLQPQGNLDVKVAAMLQQKVARLAWEKHKRWFIDLSEVNSADHSGLMSLVAAHRLALKTGRRLSLCNMKMSLVYLFEITELDRVLDILPHNEEAPDLGEKIIF
ncbi:STAS domain-containing protein [Phormidium sp. CCY1219]|uniref:STAS domain-containing protein n=1 Tax=Phormidium sp. CCY1219 TaxID=2886104 RepID=UPI002D1EB9E1|nr:STAS domain-containing protein [Phormidium sp. CCY1219]MEB3826168.1 STAS domain-containing protein [Phormidium sp. CCY1219]